MAKANRILRRSLGAGFALGVVALIVVSLLPKPVPVDLATAARGSLEVTIDEDGRTRVKDRYVVSAPITGTLGRLELRPGDTIEEGDILLRIAPLTPQLMDARTRAQGEARVAASLAAQRQARASVARAQAALDLAERDLERQRGLVESGGVSQQVFDRARFEHRARREELTSARFGVQVADYELRMARAAVGQTDRDGEDGMEVPAPVNGQILRVILESEGVVQAGTPLVEVGDPAALEIAVDVLTADAVNVVPGAHVTLERWGGDKALEGHVQRVEPSAFTKVSALGVEEQRVNVVIDIDSERRQWEALGDGYRVESRIRVWREEDALHVPASALFRHGEGWAVYRADEGLAHLTPVEVGRRNGFEAQILDGVEEGERVVVHPSDRVTDQVSIRER
ncbi:MAG: efflux RND transporter periplasmic adaptor subunit [Myxococcota bacterium]